MLSMQQIHTMHMMNLALHVGAGMAAMALGGYILSRAKGTPDHRQLGRRFAGLTLLVCATAVIGNLVFRFMPLFAMLTVLVSYQLGSGWHVVHTKARGPDLADALLWLAALGALVWMWPRLSAGANEGGASPTVLYSSLGALASLLLYDALRWCFPRRWHARLWPYEHIYKLVASLFAMLSAAIGNTVRFGQPWSQLLPSLLGVLIIGWLFRAHYRKRLLP